VLDRLAKRIERSVTRRSVSPGGACTTDAVTFVLIVDRPWRPPLAIWSSDEHTAT
jgi:hypothetical protein